MFMSPIELVAAVSGLACVVLTAKNKAIQWPIGLVQVILYIHVFIQAKLYSDAGLQVVYVFMSIYGWYHWVHGKDKQELPITDMNNWKEHNHIWLWGMLMFFGAALWGYIMQTFTDAACPYTDALIVAGSLIATWLLVQRKVEAWYFWIAVDVMAVGVYFYKDLYVTSGLYLIFLGLAFWGLKSWKRMANHA